MAGRLADATAPSPQPPGPPPARAELPADSGQRLRVLIADHDGLARWTIRTALNQTARVATVHAASDTREALQLARYYRPTVAIIDTALPPHGAVELIGKMLQITPHTRVLTISVDDHQTAIAALRAGAVGHIGKDIDPHELAHLITRAANGEAIIPQPLLTPLLQQLREIPAAGWRPLHSRLTTREWEIIDLLAQGASTQHIAEQLVLAPSTIYSHVKSVLRKLDVHSRHDAITAAEHLRKQEATSTTKPPNGTTKLPALGETRG